MMIAKLVHSYRIILTPEWRERIERGKRSSIARIRWRGREGSRVFPSG
jgi:hypothetical protein